MAWGDDFTIGTRVITSPQSSDRPKELNQIPNMKGTIIQIVSLTHVLHDDGSIGKYDKNDLRKSSPFPIGMRCATAESPVASRNWDEVQKAARKFGVQGAVREVGPFPNTWIVGGPGFRAPYEESEIIALLGNPLVYNEHYDIRHCGDCVCGHEYYRHFDPYENMEPVGCKYCQCDTFKESKMKTPQKTEEPVALSKPVEETHPFINMDTGERLTGSQVAAQEYPVRPLTPAEEREDRGHAQAILDEDDPTNNNPAIVWARKVLRAYATLDTARTYATLKEAQSAKAEWEEINGGTDRLRYLGDGCIELVPTRL